MMYKLIAFFTLLLICNACQKEEINVWQFKTPEELKTNYIEIRETTVVITDSLARGVTKIENYNLFTVDKAMFKNCKVGDVLVNTANRSGDTLAYYKKILSIVDNGNEIKFVTRDATLPEAFKRYYINSDFNETFVQTRSLINQSISINQSFGPLTVGIGGAILPSIGGGFRSDSLRFISSYDEEAGTVNNLFGPARFELHVKGLRHDMSAQLTVRAKVEGKFEIAAPAVIITPIGPTGLGFYLLPKAEATATFEGSIASPTYQATGLGPFDIDFVYADGLVTQNRMVRSAQAPRPNTTQWAVQGAGSFEFKGGAELLVAPIGGAQFAKCGVYIFNYLTPSIVHQGSFQTKESKFSLNADIGIGVQFLAEFNFFGGSKPANIPNWVPDQTKFESQDIRHIMFQPASSTVTACTFSQASLDFGQGGRSIVVSASRPMGISYTILLNGQPLPGGTNISYDQSHTITLPQITQYINEVKLQDDWNLGCYLTSSLADPNVLPADADGTVTDADGNIYATKVIGNQRWMVQNLRYKGPRNIGKVYGNPAGIELSSREHVYGRLYTFIEVANSTPETFNVNNINTNNLQGICPNGWRIPSLDDWSELRTSLGGANVGAKNMKANSRAIWATGELPTVNSFGAVPGGEFYGWIFDNSSRAFGYFGQKAFYWTSNIDRSTSAIKSSYNVFNINSDSNVENINNTPSGPAGPLRSTLFTGYSCRCVQRI